MKARRSDDRRRIPEPAMEEQSRDVGRVMAVNGGTGFWGWQEGERTKMKESQRRGEEQPHMVGRLEERNSLLPLDEGAEDPREKTKSKTKRGRSDDRKRKREEESVDEVCINNKLYEN